MDIDYSYLRAQLRTMPSTQKCNGYQLYFFEQTYEKKKTPDLSLQILDMWNSLKQQEKEVYQQKEQALLLDVRSKEESPRKASTSRSALRSTSKSHSKKKTVYIQVDEQSPKVLQEKEQFSGSRDQNVTEKEKIQEKEQMNEQEKEQEQDKEQPKVQVFEQMKDSVKDEQQEEQVDEQQLLQQTQVIQQVDQVKEDQVKVINPEDDAEVQQGQGNIVQNTEQIVEMLYQQANKGESQSKSKSNSKTTSQQHSSQKEDSKFQIQVYHVELDKQEGEHSKSSNKSQLKDEVQPIPSKSPSKGKQIHMEKVSPKKESKGSPQRLVDEGEIVQMARSGKMSVQRSDKSSSSRSIGKKSNKRFIKVQKETSPEQKRSLSRKKS